MNYPLRNTLLAEFSTILELYYWDGSYHLDGFINTTSTYIVILVVGAVKWQVKAEHKRFPGETA